MSRSRKYTLDFIAEYLGKYDYQLVSKEFSDDDRKIDIECPKKHTYLVTFKNFLRGDRCLICSGKARLTIDVVKSVFTKRGYNLLTELYINNSQKLDFICPRGHKNHITWSSFNGGHGCSKCKGHPPLDIAFVRKALAAVGYELLNNSISSSKDRISFNCSVGHTHSMEWNKFQQGRRCGICRRNGGYSLPEIKELFNSYNYTLLATKYNGSKVPLEYSCDKGHTSKITVEALKRSSLCNVCSRAGISKAQLEISDYFRSYIPELEVNTRKIISPYELDIYFPKQKVAVEYCGLYWHSELGNGVLRNKHFEKMSLCIEMGIRLITIFEDEYLSRKEVVLSRIANAINVVDKKIYARKCFSLKIENKVAKDFLEKYHLQGFGRASISFGLFSENDDLVGVITGSPLTRSHASKKRVLELKRLAFLPFLRVVGGASKLFSLFKKYALEENYEEIRSYADMRYANQFNSVYEKLGLKLLTYTKYTPHYIDHKYNKRYRNQSLRKTPQERLTGKTEWELRKEQGYDRIWDCGHRTYVLSLN